VRVYGETNFVLELAFHQEEARSCKNILAAAEAGLLELVVPAFSIVEANATLQRRLSERRQVAGRTWRLGALSSISASARYGAFGKQPPRHYD
jgi:hypothetical protein